MTSNQIKIIACVSMLIDHMGLLLFPEVQFLRWIGRLAMPIFAFFIAEGSYYTSNPMRYFGRMFGLGVLCQIVYSAEQILQGGLHSVYLNILFTFSLASLFCFVWILYKESEYNTEAFTKFILFVAAVALAFVFEIFCTNSMRVTGVKITLDYGVAGMLLPLFALPRRTKKKRMRTYAFGLILFALYLTPQMPYIWLSLLALPILWFYNGERGTSKVKYAFYIFYPLHLAVLYGIDLLV